MNVNVGEDGQDTIVRKARHIRFILQLKKLIDWSELSTTLFLPLKLSFIKNIDKHWFRTLIICFYSLKYDFIYIYYNLSFWKMRTMNNMYFLDVLNQQNIFSFILLHWFLLLDVNECLTEDLCKNNGTCVNNDGSYVCLCTESWLGKHCNNGKY